jgi:hypothetical protein
MNNTIRHGTIHVPPEDVVTHLSFFERSKNRKEEATQGTHMVRHAVPRSKDKSKRRRRRRRSDQQDRSCWTKEEATDARVQRKSCSKGKEIRVRVHGSGQVMVVEEEEQRKIILKSSLSTVNAALNPLLQMRRKRLLTGFSSCFENRTHSFSKNIQNKQKIVKLKNSKRQLPK